jgi:hypothetical protein
VFASQARDKDLDGRYHHIECFGGMRAVGVPAGQRSDAELTTMRKAEADLVIVSSKN